MIVATALMKSTAVIVMCQIIKDLPRCRQGMFECLNQNCINSTSVCDKKDDCGDSSDESDCLEKDCLDSGAHCDDGTCISPHQMCDGVFDCGDFSDERACMIGCNYQAK
ncbi:Low-density lipoprotein receptor-related protein 2 [Thelohanellus kitauei]|uniref:Low-density lipoprotein receptor-related protein 2 n=1 Tax=Thelohanellus kitauei TaxID=669202 RepID=A0A0C2N5T4_THEKT|nr:Low-density lipoprotein receptor-related protein 2 [Thelohanellus kitauei]